MCVVALSTASESEPSEPVGQMSVSARNEPSCELGKAKKGTKQREKRERQRGKSRKVKSEGGARKESSEWRHAFNRLVLPS